MDITRNWRLKTSRDQLLAARVPEDGSVILPQQTSFSARRARLVEAYEFESDTPAPVTADENPDFIRAAR
jgi:hypothetical protein